VRAIHWSALVTLLVALLVGVAVAAVLLGAVPLAPGDVWAAVRGDGAPATLAISACRAWRLPR
jgi:ABC-type enterobactin transport system permease subunit